MHIYIYIFYMHIYIYNLYSANVQSFSKIIKNTFFLFILQIFRSHFGSFFCTSNFTILFSNILQQ